MTEHVDHNHVMKALGSVAHQVDECTHHSQKQPNGEDVQPKCECTCQYSQKTLTQKITKNTNSTCQNQRNYQQFCHEGNVDDEKDCCCCCELAKITSGGRQSGHPGDDPTQQLDHREPSQDVDTTTSSTHNSLNERERHMSNESSTHHHHQHHHHYEAPEPEHHKASDVNAALQKLMDGVNHAKQQHE